MTRQFHEPRPLGKGGLRVSAIGWGMWRYRGSDLTAARRLVETALEAGINFFDTADVYGLDNSEPFGAAETLLGQVLAAAPHLRSKMVLATKGGIQIGTPYNSSASYLIEACEASLRRLRVEQVELFQIHRPDNLAHPSEVAEAFEKLRAAGKIAEAGISNYSTSQTAALLAHLPFPLASTQPEFSPLVIEPITNGLLDQAIERRLAVLAWSPLAGGRLVRTGSDARSQAVSAALDAVAAREGVSRAAVICAWVMQHPSRPVAIVGTQQLDRLRDAATAMAIRLSRADWYAIFTAARGESLP